MKLSLKRDDNNRITIPQTALLDFLVAGSFGEKCEDLKNISHQGDGGEFEINPIAEFISSKKQDNHMEFDHYNKKHGKKYEKHEYKKRQDLFKHNKR